MPLPSKQKKLNDELMSFIGKHSMPGMKLPSERELAKNLHVARRTLRYTLDELEMQKIIQRTNRGTFVVDVKEKNNGNNETISILVACPDYVTESGYYSSYLTQQMIQGALLSARTHGTYAVTLPITEDNKPEHINWQQFRHLGQNDIVMFTGIWTKELYLELAQRGCRLGYICDAKDMLPDVNQYGIDFFNFYLGDYWRCLGDAVRILSRDGAKKIVYFGRSSTDISQNGRPFFEAALREEKLECRNEFYHLYNGKLPLGEVLNHLKLLYQELKFDGLIFDTLYQGNLEFNFFERTQIPESTHFIFSVSELLKQSELPKHARVLYRPQRESSKMIADFLLSGKHGQIISQMEYKFPRIADFFTRS